MNRRKFLSLLGLGTVGAALAPKAAQAAPPVPKRIDTVLDVDTTKAKLALGGCVSNMSDRLYLVGDLGPEVVIPADHPLVEFGRKCVEAYEAECPDAVTIHAFRLDEREVRRAIAKHHRSNGRDEVKALGVGPPETRWRVKGVCADGSEFTVGGTPENCVYHMAAVFADRWNMDDDEVGWRADLVHMLVNGADTEDLVRRLKRGSRR